MDYAKCCLEMQRSECYHHRQWMSQGTTFLVQCPQQQNTTSTKITKINTIQVFYYDKDNAISVNNDNKTKAHNREKKNLTYYVLDHVNCELDSPLRQPSKDTTIVGTAYLHTKNTSE